MKAPLYTQDGTKKGETALNAVLFEAKINPGLVHEAVLMQLDNARVDTAMTLAKGQVRGGGRKPYRQKGTGRARQGSIRNPHYRGGGVAFGPRGNRNYENLMPRKQRQAALFSALSAQAKEGAISVLEKFESKLPKTKVLSELLQKLPLKRKVLVVVPESSPVLEKSARNLPNVRTVHVQYLNVLDVLWADSLLFVGNALEKTADIFSNS